MAKSLCKCGAWVDDADIPTHPCCGVVGDRAKLIADLNRIKVWQELNPATALLVRYAAKELADLETENAALRAVAQEILDFSGPPMIRHRSEYNAAVAKFIALNHARSERVIKGETKVTTIYIVYGWTAYESSDDICAFVNKSDAEAFAESLRVYDETRPLFVTKHEQGTGAHEKAFDRYWAKEQKWTKAHPAGCERNNWDIFELELRGPTP